MAQDKIVYKVIEFRTAKIKFNIPENIDSLDVNRLADPDPWSDEAFPYEGYVINFEFVGGEPGWFDDGQFKLPEEVELEVFFTGSHFEERAHSDPSALKLGIKYGTEWIEKRIYDVIVFKEEIDGFKGSAKTKIKKWDDPMVGWGP